MAETNENAKAAESVRRIQDSLKNIAVRTEQPNGEFPGTIEGMLDRLSQQAREHTRQSDAYQKYAGKPNVTALLSEAMQDMNGIAVALSSVLRDKHGIQVDRPGYKVIKALPWHYEDIAQELKLLGEGDWSSKAMWEIERVLRDSAPRTEPSGTEELVRINTHENSAEFAAAVNGLTQQFDWDTEDSLEAVKAVLSILRGRPYDEAAEKE